MASEFVQFVESAFIAHSKKEIWKWPLFAHDESFPRLRLEQGG